MEVAAPKPWVELWLELETRCNLKCPFCYNYWKSGSLPEPSRASRAATVAGLQRILASVDCRKVAVSGGEPLLRSDLLELLSAIREFHVPMVLTTNGVLLSAKRLQDLMDAGIAHFQVPLHSHQPATHDLLSGVQCWDQSLRAILRVQERGAGITPVFVATGLNVMHFGAVLRIFGQLGLTKVIFNRFIPSGAGERYRDNIGVPTEPALIEAVDEAQRIAESYNIKIELGVPLEVSDQVRARWTQVQIASCPVRAGQRRWTIGSDLSIRRCNHSAVSVGHLFDHGVDRMLAELASHGTEMDGDEVVHSCQFLRPSGLVQVRVC